MRFLGWLVKSLARRGDPDEPPFICPTLYIQMAEERDAEVREILAKLRQLCAGDNEAMQILNRLEELERLGDTDP